MLREQIERNFFKKRWGGTLLTPRFLKRYARGGCTTLVSTRLNVSTAFWAITFENVGVSVREAY